jgi:hypothetical protein
MIRHAELPLLGWLGAWPFGPSLRQGLGLATTTAKVCDDEGFDIHSAITDAPADSDKWATTSVSAFAVKRAQTAPEKSGRFRRCKKRL